MKRSRTDSRPLRVERLAVEVVLDDVLHLHDLRRERAREEVALRVARRAQADVAVGVDHAVRGEDAVGGDEVFEVIPFQSALMPAALTTRVQRGELALHAVAERSGVPPAGVRPCFSSTSRTSRILAAAR